MQFSFPRNHVFIKGVTVNAIIRAALVVALLVAAAHPAAAQVDFSGEWAPVRSMDNTENPWVGDWVGLPLKPDGVARAEGWDASLLSLPEYQCRPHGWTTSTAGRRSCASRRKSIRSRARSSHYQPEWHQSTNMPVYLDGRDRPPARGEPYVGRILDRNVGRRHAAHQDDALEKRTTSAAMVRWRATRPRTSFWIRRGDYLTWINIVHDPIYLAEPLIRSPEYRLKVNSIVPAHPCTSAFEGLEKGHVPHFLPARTRSSWTSARATACPPTRRLAGRDDVSRVPEVAAANEWSRGDRRGGGAGAPGGGATPGGRGAGPGSNR